MEMDDAWQSGDPYERFMGRWSTLVARDFLDWLGVGPARTWLDVGCGTGTLTKAILESQKPAAIIAVDSSSRFITYAQQQIVHPAVRFRVGLAQSLDLASNAVDAVVSGLMLNFVPAPGRAVAEMRRVAKPGGRIGIFLWDYAAGMQMLRYFWDAAVALDHDARAFDEGLRFPLCQADPLLALVREAGLRQVELIPIDVTTHFQNFDDYWLPFLGETGPAPSYAMSLDQPGRQSLAERVHDALPIAADGSISLVARAWAVKGRG